MVLLSCGALRGSARIKIRQYRQLYINRPDPIAFMPVAVDTNLGNENLIISAGEMTRTRPRKMTRRTRKDDLFVSYSFDPYSPCL